MNDHAVTLTVESPQGQQTLRIEPSLRDRKLTELLRRAGLSLNTRCGQRGLCDGCVVELIQGELTGPDGQRIAASAEGKNVRACETTVGDSAASLRVPPRSLLAYEPQVVSEFRVNVPRAHDPLWQVVTLKAAEAADASSLAAAVARKLEMFHPPRLDESIPAALAAARGQSPLYAVVEYRGDHWDVTDLSVRPPEPPVGVAIDIGTTTVALLLVDLAGGRIVSSASGFNRQMHLGDDVLTRINLCMSDSAMLKRLQHAVVGDTIQRLLLKAMKAADVSDARITCLTVAANTTMLHLLAGVDPTPMGTSPFTPNFVDYRWMPASTLSLHLSSQVTASEPVDIAVSAPPPAVEEDETPQPVNAADPVLHLLPSASAYVGADLTAGIFSSGLAYDEGPSLLVDVGTNGEIILKHGEKLYGCATAAGPAFEGARLACGMRAGAGAISRVRIAPDGKSPLVCDIETIGGIKPTGLCGSAYVDFLAQGRRAGLISETGRFERGVADDRIGPYKEYARAFRVAFGHGKEPIVVAETDIASLLQAKAAIAAGILILLQKISVRPEQIKTLYLAGGFGMHLDIANTIACGLLPGFHPEQVQVVGNTSLAGAYLGLLDSGVMDELNRIARRVQIVELNLDPDFEGCYIDQLRLP